MTRLSRILLLVLLCLPFGFPAPLLAEKHEDEALLLDAPTRELMAMDFTTDALRAKTFTLSDFRGKVVFLNFWATWCIPCRVEMPSMQRLHKAMQGLPFIMVAVNQGESIEKVQAYAQKHKLDFEMVLDVFGDIGEMYGANQLPLTYIISRDGKVLRRAIGAREWDSELSVNYFKRLASMPVSGAKPSGAAEQTADR